MQLSDECNWMPLYLRLTDEEFTQLLTRLMVCKRRHVPFMNMAKSMKDIRQQRFSAQLEDAV